jgi:topoisomerase-4 subunit B
MASKKIAAYGDSDVEVLKGLQPVQLRPGMYTRTENPNHIIQEIADNAFDEALAGSATQILVEQHEDGSVSVQDNGRGIPVGMHPTEKRPTVEVVFTSLHAGGKFKKEGVQSAYGFAGGLHGVGVSVTNALSERLEVTVWRDGFEHNLVFSHGAVVEQLSKKRLPAEEAKRTGSRIQSWPAAKYFESAQLHVAELERFLRSKAVLLDGVEVVWTRPGRAPIAWSFPGGMRQYLEEGTEDPEAWVAPRFQTSFHHKDGALGFAEGEGFDLALGFTEPGRISRPIRESYVNLIPTPAGGRHENGLRLGLFEAVRAVAERRNLIPKNIKIEADDVASRTSYMLSVQLMDPQFQNQTKDRMTSEKGQRLVQGAIRDNFELWLNDHPEHAASIIELAIDAAVYRQKGAVLVSRKRSAGASTLPGKLADCISKNLETSELFLVEGDSAGGSAKQGRDKNCQAIFPLKGKLLNTWEVDSDRLHASEGVSDIATAIGVDPHPGKKVSEVDLTGLRYGKIFIMADADIDGLHIQVLLITLFLRHFPALIESGHIWIAQSPLYRIDAPAKRGSKEGPRKFYALDEKELSAIEKQLQKEGLQSSQYSRQRFKGLGEMNPKQLWETTMDPADRRALRVCVQNAALAFEKFELMMGGKNAKQRREWMERDGGSVEVDV